MITNSTQVFLALLLEEEKVFFFYSVILNILFLNDLFLCNVL